MKKIIAAALVITAILCFSTLPLSTEKGTVWCTYGTGSVLQSNIQAERGVYFNATDFGLVYPVYLNSIAANLADEGYTCTYRVYDQNGDSLIYEGVFTGSSVVGYNIHNFTEPIILNRGFTVSMTPESSGLPGLGHSEQTVSEHSFYKTGGGNWDAFSSAEVRYEWNIYAKMSNVNDYDAPKIVTISGLENEKEVDATITITVQDDSAISEIYGQYDLGAGWVQFAMTATKADYIYSGTLPGQPADTSIPVRFYLKDGLNNSGYSSTYTAKWTGGLPINVTISYSDSTVTLGWQEVVGTSKYYIYCKTDPYGTSALIDSTTSNNWSGNFASNKKFFEVTAAYALNLTSPNGAESWLIGSTHNITWTDNFTENVKIELYKATVLAATISSSTESDGTYSWVIPTLTSGADYQIKISSIANPAVFDESNANFTIPSTVTVTSPNGAESWLIGSTHNITWIDNFTENVKIELYKATVLAATISSSTESDGTYSWLIPTTLMGGADYKVKITSTTNATLMDESNSYFTIAAIVSVQGGTFAMGDHFSEGNPNELPLHNVTLNSFYIGKYEVTQSEWAFYMPVVTYNDGSGATYPVYYVSWYEIIKYCNLRSIAEGLTPCYTISSSIDPLDWGSPNSTWDAVICNWDVNGYRLPTEAEWEYAARGGIHNSDNLRYSGCNLVTDLTNYAWYGGGGSRPVGTKLPNQLGIYDMSGNLCEWCWDWYSYIYYQYCIDNSISTNPKGPATGDYNYRTGRGGTWGGGAYPCRVAGRPCPPDYGGSGGGYPYDKPGYGGFRVARTH